MSNIALAIHGGAGTILRSKMTPDKERLYTAALDVALTAGYKVLKQGGSSLDAVEKAVVELENCHLFNAGKGSVFTANGLNEMDASIMSGYDLSSGAVSLVTTVKNPVSLARLVMEKSGHVFLGSHGAEQFAADNGCELVDKSYFYDQLRYEQWKEAQSVNRVQLDHSSKVDEKFGTVGAVALDMYGNLASATSTGGMTNKQYGRIGDTPIIGAGTYANNKTCAVSCTGNGEFLIKQVAAYDVSCLMEHKESSLTDACQQVVHKRLLNIGGQGGLIAVDAQGNTCLEFNTAGMYRASINKKGEKEILIYK